MANLLSEVQIGSSSLAFVSDAAEQGVSASLQLKIASNVHNSVTGPVRLGKDNVGGRPNLKMISLRPKLLRPVKRMAAAVAYSVLTSAPAVQPAAGKRSPAFGRIVTIHTRRGLELALDRAGDRLVVVEYAGSQSINSARIRPAIVELSEMSQDTVFLKVVGDESQETMEICQFANVTKVPFFQFYKNGEVVHEEAGVDEDQLLGNVLYHGENDAPIVQLHGTKDVELLLEKHAQDHKLVVIDINLKFCGPCAKVYPTVVNLAKQMASSVVFARMIGDENESCKDFLRIMDIKEVPTFLFIRDGQLCGQYVGSKGGSLVGEILRYQGVKCT